MSTVVLHPAAVLVAEDNRAATGAWHGTERVLAGGLAALLTVWLLASAGPGRIGAATHTSAAFPSGVGSVALPPSGVPLNGSCLPEPPSLPFYSALPFARCLLAVTVTPGGEDRVYETSLGIRALVFVRDARSDDRPPYFADEFLRKVEDGSAHTAFLPAPQGALFASASMSGDAWVGIISPYVPADMPVALELTEALRPPVDPLDARVD